MSTKPLRLMLLAAVVGGSVASSGCHLRPEWGSPGDMNSQRARSMQHDPYPSNELGPPILGIRPRDYDQPRSEVTQLQANPLAQPGQAGAPLGY